MELNNNSRLVRKKILINFLFKGTAEYLIVIFITCGATFFEPFTLLLNLLILLIYLIMTLLTLKFTLWGFRQAIFFFMGAGLMFFGVGTWIQYTSMPSKFSLYSIIFVAIGIIIFFIKRQFDIDYEHIRTALRKTNRYNITTGAYFIDNGSANSDVKRIYKKSEITRSLLQRFAGPLSWILILAVYLVPAMPYMLNGVDNNKPVNYFFFICASSLAALMMYGIQRTYAFYKVLREVEKENGIKLRPVYRP